MELLTIDGICGGWADPAFAKERSPDFATPMFDLLMPGNAYRARQTLAPLDCSLANEEVATSQSVCFWSGPRGDGQHPYGDPDRVDRVL